MRNTVMGALFVSLAIAPACASSISDDDTIRVGALSDDELARSSLEIMGAKVNGQPGAGLCQSCHDVDNRTTFKKWSDQYQATMTILSDTTKSKEERIHSMLRDPADEKSGFYPGKIGILTAGAHLGVTTYVRKEKHPITFEQNTLLADLFDGRDDLFEQFKTDTLMPVEPRFDRLSPTQYETIVTWMKKGMPHLADYIADAGRPTTCTDDFTKLRDHAHQIKATSWAAANRDAKLPMFACPANVQPADCFQQKGTTGDLFPLSSAMAYAKGWSVRGDSFRILRELEYGTFYWSRTSPDGRFFAAGGGPREDNTRAVVADLAAALDPSGPKTRDILVAAAYDPDFYPSNNGFMFQGTNKGGAFCSMSLLTNPATKKITFDEPQCTKLDAISLYQTVGQVTGDNSIGDIFVANSTFASDNPSLTNAAHDLQLTAGPEAKVTVHVGLALGNDADSGYQVRQHVELPTPFKGDTMMSRTGSILGSRVAGETHALGYAIDRLTSTKSASGYKFALAPLGRICMPGNKANISFDERFLVSHHYVTREDFPSDEAFKEYGEKGASDLWLADFVTGEKTRIAQMAPGQFALFPHFRSDGWIMFEVRDANTKKVYVVASDAAIRATIKVPTP